MTQDGRARMGEARAQARRLWLPPPGFARQTRREGARRRMAALLRAHGVGAALARRVMEAALERAGEAPFEAALAEGLACVFRFEPLHPRPSRPMILARLEAAPLEPLAEWLARRARMLGAEAMIIGTGADGRLAAAAARAGARHALAPDLAGGVEAARRLGEGACVWIAPPPLGEAPGADADAVRRLAQDGGAEVLAVAPRLSGGGLSAGAPAFARAGARRLAALSAEGDALGSALDLAAGGLALAAFADPLSAGACENASPAALGRRIEAVLARPDTVQAGGEDS